MTRARTLGIAVAATVTIGVTGVAIVMARRADDQSDAARLIDVLNLQAGSTVAEIGAGDGEITILVAKHVGPTGRVYTTELGEDRVKKLKAAVERAQADTVTVLEAHAMRSNLSSECCDAIFMRSVYHHFEDPAAMNKSFFDALRPGGRLAVMDFAPPPGGEAANAADRDQDGHHGVTSETALAELTRAGFERVLVEAEAGSKRGFLVVVKKG